MTDMATLQNQAIGAYWGGPGTLSGKAPKQTHASPVRSHSIRLLRLSVIPQCEDSCENAWGLGGGGASHSVGLLGPHLGPTRGVLGGPGPQQPPKPFLGASHPPGLVGH